MNRLTLLALLALLALLNIGIYRELFAPPVVTVEALSVGKERGESRTILVRVPRGGHAILIGAGPDASILRALGESLPPWQRQVAVLILSDMGAKTAGGAPFVLRRYDVAALLRPATLATPAREAALVAALETTGTRITTIPPGAELILHYESLSLSLSSALPGRYLARP